MVNQPRGIRYLAIEIGSLLPGVGVKVVTADQFHYRFTVRDGPGLELVSSDDPAVPASPGDLRAIFGDAGRPTLRSGQALHVGRLGRNGISFQDVHALAEVVALEIERAVR